jgi:membrane protein
MRFRAILELLQETLAEWSKDKVSRLAAALSYYTIFSIAPLLIIVIAVAGAFFGEDAARGAIEKQLQGLIGDGAIVIQTAIKNANKPQQGTIASLISLVILIFGATGLFAELQDSLNTIWKVKPKPGRAVKTIIRQRFLSFTLVFGIGFLLLVSLVISTTLSLAIGYFQNILPDIEIVWRATNLFLGFGITTALFALIFKVLPDVKIAWTDVWIGATLTSLLFSLGRFLLGRYLSQAGFSSTYGAAGSIVAILVWVNYAAQILFFGAEFTQVYARKYGSQIIPDKNAVSLTEGTELEPEMQLNNYAKIGRNSRKKRGLFSWLRQSKRK